MRCRRISRTLSETTNLFLAETCLHATYHIPGYVACDQDEILRNDQTGLPKLYSNSSPSRRNGCVNEEHFAPK